MFLYHNDIELEISVSENNVNIKNSFKVKSKKDMYEIIKRIKENNPSNRIVNLSNFLLVQEWASHNLCYQLGLYKGRTRDVDLDANKPWYIKIVYGIFGFLYF